MQNDVFLSCQLFEFL